MVQNFMANGRAMLEIPWQKINCTTDLRKWSLRDGRCLTPAAALLIYEKPYWVSEWIGFNVPPDTV